MTYAPHWYLFTLVLRLLLPVLQRDLHRRMQMSEERQDVITEDASAPRWVGIVVVALAVVSLVALGAGWTASTRSKELEQNLATQNEQSKKNNEVMDQRLAKAEDT